MKRLMVLLALAATVAVPAAGLADEARHSGLVVAVDPAANTLRLEEMLAWTGPTSGVVERTVRLGPGTSIRLLRPAEDAAATWPDAWEASPLTASDLRPGDYVTAITRDGGDVATTLDVVRPGG
jgi:hypothetical protein